ncbi:Dynein heavy chain-like protein [Frankliniella fusca]|uniref:Dynein heavy chain-like protein n=1 Tax=Frankliniella fusca TaxID=407009 RepID=A0AAE1HQQ0_9NEOP|nr:Dynein heavy chain-like protein [Frankliniella fusca]
MREITSPSLPGRAAEGGTDTVLILSVCVELRSLQMKGAGGVGGAVGWVVLTLGLWVLSKREESQSSEDGSPTEETYDEQTSEQDRSCEDTSDEQTSDQDTSRAREETSVEQTSEQDRSCEETSVEQTSEQDRSCEETSVGQTSEQDRSREETSVEQTSEQDRSCEDTSDEQRSEQDRSCEETSDEETSARFEWQRYVRDGCSNYDLACELLGRVYSPLQPLPVCRMFKKIVQEKGLSYTFPMNDTAWTSKVLDISSLKALWRQHFRHEAEAKFFNSHSPGARDLMREVAGQLYRTPSSEADPIDLRGKSAGLVIAASRLLHETLITLSGSFNPVQGGKPLADTYRGIPVARTKKHYRGFLHYGPPESYTVGDDASGGTAVTCEHRTDQSTDPVDQRNLERLGDSFVSDVKSYQGRNGIISVLKKILQAFIGQQQRTEAEAQEHLADLFIQYAQSHRFDATPELTRHQRRSLYRICFLILEKEQSQWQSACFWWGKWKLGMTVSFARLIILFKWGVITIDDLFRTYAIYSKQGMRDRNDEVKKFCDEIDTLYECEAPHKNPSSTNDPYADLQTVYGEGATTREIRCTSPRKSR